MRTWAQDKTNLRRGAHHSAATCSPHLKRPQRPDDQVAVEGGRVGPPRVLDVPQLGDHHVVAEREEAHDDV